MKYTHIARYVMETPWAILRSKLDEIEAILQFHMEGGKFSAEELRARIGEPSRPNPTRNAAIAVLPLQGVIAHRMGSMSEMSGGISTERFSQIFRQAMADESVTGIVIDVDSPGGTISGVPELAAEILAARGKKPIVAHANALMASAAYYIGSAADEVVATPSAMVGSIGVIMAHVDTSRAEEAEGIKRTVIHAGKFKAEGHGPLSEEAKEALQARVDEAYALMTKDIAKARGITPAAVRSGYGEGRVLSAAEAKKAGMVDRVATLEETIARLAGRGSRGGMRAEDAEVAIRSEDPETATLIAVNREFHEEADRRRRMERF
jgi:signal peptide peptidase SppA